VRKVNISIRNLCTTELNCRLSVDFKIEGALVLFDKDEDRASAILKCLVDEDFIVEGGIFINNLSITEFYEVNNITEVFGYIFNEGIMLSNLSVKENFLLPYKLRWKNADMSDFELKIKKWLDFFQLSQDLNQRPAFIKPAILKQLCFIRTLLLEPKILLIDNPYYLLNQFQRQKLFHILIHLKNTYPMLIASTDKDFTKSFADTVILLQENGRHVIKKVAK
jgi:phospholipid/cholesterol/gamma-HCH transport system ATP-binding protein